MPVPINQWGEMAEQQWSSLLLGNGASITLNEGFRYPTLHGVADAAGLLPNTAPLFRALGTTDFEHVLLGCWYAEKVNAALRSPSADITKAYAEVRSALIEAVRVVHPEHASIVASLQRAAAFASTFPTVVTLNYDVTLYWAMLLFNATNGNWFKDAFVNGKFKADWQDLRAPYGAAKGATLVFYPHGSLIISREYLGGEVKLAAGPAQDLLGTIAAQWTTGEFVPVFVSEGASADKLSAIRRSRYLSSIYDDVLPGLGEGLVVYGWSLDERDRHILSAIGKKAPRRLAVSVFTGQPPADQQRFCHRVLAEAAAILPGTVVEFFDSQSPGCWSNA